MRSAGIDPPLITLSRSTIRRRRMENREATAVIGTEINISCETCLVVHWDSKLLQDLIGEKKLDRLPVLVAGNSVEQILSVPKLQRGTGEAQARAVVKSL